LKMAFDGIVVYGDASNSQPDIFDVKFGLCF